MLFSSFTLLAAFHIAVLNAQATTEETTGTVLQPIDKPGKNKKKTKKKRYTFHINFFFLLL